MNGDGCVPTDLYLCQWDFNSMYFSCHEILFFVFFFFSIKKLETWAFRQCTKTGGWQDSALRLQLADSEQEEEFGNTCYQVAMASTGELALLQKVKCWKKHNGIGSPHSFSLIHLILWYFHSIALNRHMNFDIFFFLKHLMSITDITY